MRTELVYYEYTAVAYSLYFSFYTDFIVVYSPDAPPLGASIGTSALVGIVCGSVAAVLVVAGIVFWLFRSNDASAPPAKGAESSTSHPMNESNVVTTEVNETIGSMVNNEEDMWI